MRSFGVLLHVSSLPSSYGIGDLGPAAYNFASSLAQAGASVWQVLPLHPTSTYIGNSPYSSPSAFAGNPLFISPELLVRDAWLSGADVDTALSCVPQEPSWRRSPQVDFAAVSLHREHLLRAAFERNSHKLAEHKEFQHFCREHDGWLHDYARFVTLKAAHNGISWVDWAAPFKRRESEALQQWDADAAHAMLREKFIQYLFFSQWLRLRAFCNEHGIRLLADVPIYVTHDSADVWAAPHYFNLDEAMLPVTVSGVPPDYFSETGQRWGTPVYRWDVLAEDNFSWWKKRLGHELLLADRVRLDHFRGYCGYWDIPADEQTAVNGQWLKAPGERFLQSLKEHFGGLPFLAEDLGVITDDVCAAMQAYELPGMHVLQFAFGGADLAKNPDIPFRHEKNSFVYTGTHDNTPTRDWFSSISEAERANVRRYCGAEVTAESAANVLARQAFASVAESAVLPMQDVLNLGAEGRMNTPGVATGNWAWRLTQDQARPEHLDWLAVLADTYGRLPRREEEQSLA